MQLSTFLFMIFLVITLLIHNLLPRKARWVWLLLASYAFCVWTNVWFGVILLAITSVTYLCGWRIGRSDQRATKKTYLVVGILSALATLFAFKYFNFSIKILNDLFDLIGASTDLTTFNLLLPLGLSFYSFQAVSYLIDCYNGLIQPERNFGKFALYLAFFPRLISGPIERADHLLPQIYHPRPFEYQRFVDALLRIGWGFFKKLVIADRLPLIITPVFTSPAEYFAPQVVFAAIAFSLQIYLDFSAYCDIAIGAASLLGIDLVENFNFPYLARSVTDFWRRWHISLSNWLRDYLFIPLNFAARRKKEKVWQYLIIVVVFLVSGIWHGANYTFIIWGLLHGIFQAVEAATLKFRTRLEKKFTSGVTGGMLRAIQIVATFVMVTFAWIFFRAENMGQALGMIKVIVTLRGALHGIAYDMSKLGPTPADYWILAVAFAIFAAVELLNQKHTLLQRIKSLPLPVRWVLYLSMIFAVILFGVFGDLTKQDFIYAGF